MEMNDTETHTSGEKCCLEKGVNLRRLDSAGYMKLQLMGGIRSGGRKVNSVGNGLESQKARST